MIHVRHHRSAEVEVARMATLIVLAALAILVVLPSLLDLAAAGR